MPVRDFKLDPNTWDLAVEGGDFVLAGSTADMDAATAIAADQAAVEQGIKVRVLTFLGEIWLDESQGVPWLQYILKKGADPIVAREAIRSAIANTPDVVQVIDVSLDVDRVNRIVTASWQVITVYSSTALASQITMPSTTATTTVLP